MKQIVALLILIIQIATAIHAADLPPQFMDEDEIEIGMEGYGLTSFEPGVIEKFEFKVLGIQKNRIGPGLDLILVDVFHPRLQNISIVAGMSGSPVYINDRMIGAVGYGWTTSLRAIGGVTPIRKMLEVYDYKSPAAIAQSAESGAPEPRAIRFNPDRKPWDRSHPEFNRAISIHRSELADAGILPDEDWIELQPLVAPVMMSSVPDSIYPLVQKSLGAIGFKAVNNGSLSSAVDAEAAEIDIQQIEAGAPIGVELAGGDMTLGGIGTVTHRDGDRLLAFGHSMNQNGMVNLPISTVKIFTILPSRDSPFKMGALQKHVGTLTHDFAAAVGGKLGPIPRMIPVKVHIVQKDRDIDRELNIRLANDKQYSATLSYLSIVNSLAAVDQMNGPSTVRLKYRIFLGDGSVVEKENFVSGEPIIQAVGQPAFRDMSYITDNPYRKIEVDHIEYDIEAKDGIHLSTILSAYSTRNVYLPGETITIKVKLLEYLGAEYTRTLQISAPQTTGSKQYLVAVMDSVTRYNLALLKKPFGSSPVNWEQLLELIQLDFPNDQLYVSILESQPGIQVESSELAGLPPSIYASLQNAASDVIPSQIPFNEIVSKSWPLDAEFSGTAFFAIEVNQKGK